MKLFNPTMIFTKLTDIDEKVFKNLNVNALLLDVDNTLSDHGSKEPSDGVLDWIIRMKSKGYKVIAISNNFNKRVSKFALMLNIPYVSFSLKPLPFGINKAIRKLNTNKEQAIIIGDQIFTDVLGANLSGIKSILLEPLFEDKLLHIQIKRFFEKKIRQNIKCKGE